MNALDSRHESRAFAHAFNGALEVDKTSAIVISNSNQGLAIVSNQGPAIVKPQQLLITVIKDQWDTSTNRNVCHDAQVCSPVPSSYFALLEGRGLG